MRGAGCSGWLHRPPGPRLAVGTLSILDDRRARFSALHIPHSTRHKCSTQTGWSQVSAWRCRCRRAANGGDSAQSDQSRRSWSEGRHDTTYELPPSCELTKNLWNLCLSALESRLSERLNLKALEGSWQDGLPQPHRTSLGAAVLFCMHTYILLVSMLNVLRTCVM